LSSWTLSSQGEPAGLSGDSPNGSEVDVGIEEVLDEITGQKEKRGPGRPETTGEFQRKKLRDAQRALRFKEMEKTRRAADALRSSPPKGKKKWAMVQKREELEYELAETILLLRISPPGWWSSRSKSLRLPTAPIV